MAYVWLKWLADALRAEGCKVREYDGWQSRGRPSSSGSFDPDALLIHHTGTKSSYSNPAPTLSTCVHGRSDLPGPLAHVVIGYDGTCHVIAAGRANHAGECNGNGPTSSGDGNAQMIGFEVDYSGSQDVSPEQADATIRASAAVLRHLGRNAEHARGHKETSVTGKWDPGRNGSSSSAYSMPSVRDLIADRLGGSPGGGGDMPEYVSLSGPGFTLGEADDWHAVKLTTESSDSGKVHPDGYAWLNLGGARYVGQVRLVDCERETPETTLVVRWAEYDVDSGAFVSAPALAEYPLTTGTTGVHDHVVDSCSSGNRVRAEVKARSGQVIVGSVGLTAVYWR